MRRRWWWPFGRDSEEEKADKEFRGMIQEALLRQDDLRIAAESLKRERERRKLKAHQSVEYTNA